MAVEIIKDFGGYSRPERGYGGSTEQENLGRGLRWDNVTGTLVWKKI